MWDPSSWESSPTVMRDTIAATGVSCIVIAAFLLSMVFGLVVLGACLITLAVILSLEHGS